MQQQFKKKKRHKFFIIYTHPNCGSFRAALLLFGIYFITPDHFEQHCLYLEFPPSITSY